MNDSFFAYLAEKEVEYKRNEPIKWYSSVKIGGTADVAVFPDNREKLCFVLKFLYENKINYRVVGKMTNLRPQDNGYDGVLVFTSKLNGYSIDGHNVRAECGAVFSLLLFRLSIHSLGGAEALLGIPGSVGGMIYSNAGAFGLEISDFLTDATVVDIESGCELTLLPDDLHFSYRKSILSDKKYILLDAGFEFERMPTESILAEMNRFKRKRLDTQPTAYPSLGSVFKKAGEVSAGRLIDECGLKGTRIGGAKVSEKHAGFIVNAGGATSAEFKRLIQIVTDKVYENHGVKLEMEIEFM